MEARAWLAVCCCAAVLAACGDGGDSEPVQITDAAVDGRDDTRLTLGLNACEAVYTVESIEETPGEVLILVHRSPKRTDEPEPACEDSFEVELSSPIAERKLIDASSGKDVMVAVTRVPTG